MKWRKINNPPKESGYYLVCLRYPNKDYFDVHGFTKDSRNFGDVWHGWNGDARTHWMPLPEPPHV